MHGKLYARKGAWLCRDDEAGKIYLAQMVDAYTIRQYSELEIAT